MGVTYESLTETLIPNTTIDKGFIDGVHKVYRIQAVVGYLLHDSRIDEEELDLVTLMPTGNTKPRFKSGSTTVSASYDFNTVVNGTYTYTDENGNEITLNVLKIGEYEFYTVPEEAEKRQAESLPEDALRGETIE